MGYYLPVNYERINISAGTYNPSTIKARNNRSYAYWMRSLYNRLLSVLKFRLPEDWQGSIKDFFCWCIYDYGFVTVFDQPKYGVIFQPCSLAGYNIYYQPTKALVANPVFDRELTIAEDCELIKLTPDYMGVFDILDYYAEKLSTLDVAINTSIINSKIGWILGARNKSTAEALKKALDEINKGNPATILDSKLIKNTATKPGEEKIDPWILIDFNVKNNYILTDQLKDFQTLLNNFDAEIGIPTIPYQKAERMVSSEAESRKIDSTARVSIWLETLNNSMDIVNRKFGLNLSAEYKYNDVEGGADDVDSTL